MQSISIFPSGTGAGYIRCPVAASDVMESLRSVMMQGCVSLLVQSATHVLIKRNPQGNVQRHLSSVRTKEDDNYLSSM
jgi:hypothetical protein